MYCMKSATRSARQYSMNGIPRTAATTHRDVTVHAARYTYLYLARYTYLYLAIFFGEGVAHKWWGSLSPFFLGE